ncbi:MAG: hypothetical protein LBP65_01560 [Puniceicoccales bacterium]|nr:hypothetical protein [Puniceicoccales bacterium]
MGRLRDQDAALSFLTKEIYKKDGSSDTAVLGVSCDSLKRGFNCLDFLTKNKRKLSAANLVGWPLGEMFGIFTWLAQKQPIGTSAGDMTQPLSKKNEWEALVKEVGSSSSSIESNDVNELKTFFEAFRSDAQKFYSSGDDDDELPDESSLEELDYSYSVPVTDSSKLRDLVATGYIIECVKDAIFKGEGRNAIQNCITAVEALLGCINKHPATTDVALQLATIILHHGAKMLAHLRASSNSSSPSKGAFCFLESNVQVLQLTYNSKKNKT